jgi:uncharacterized protein (DUF58 family)
MRISITREGKRFLLAVAIVGFAAFNTGNNLMYLTFAMLMSTLVFSLAMLFFNLKGLEVEFSVEEPVFAASYATLRLTVRNTKRFIPSFSLRFILPGLLEDGIFIDRIPASGSREILKKIMFHKRGLYRVKDTKLRSGFPFIFFYLTHRPPGSTKVIVYPVLYDLRQLRIQEYILQETSGTQPVRTGDYLQSIREYQPGDLWRNIHWKATAKTGRFMVKEFYRQETDMVTIIIDNSKTPNEEHFEKAVSLAATLVNEYILQGLNVRLLSCGKAFPFGSGMEHLYRILDHLAVIRMREDFTCSIKDIEEGLTILVLPSEGSSLTHLSSMVDRVYYASNI